MQSNFTWGKALGTGATVQATSQFTVTDPYNISRGYGTQSWDRKFTYNMFFVYEPPFYKGQQGALGRVLGGWRFAPIFTAASGLPLMVSPASNGNGSTAAASPLAKPMARTSAPLRTPFSSVGITSATAA